VGASPKLFRGLKLRLKVERLRLWGASPPGDPICARSGSMLHAEMVTERLLSKISQLSQFGLAPADRPLLKPASDDFSFVASSATPPGGMPPCGCSKVAPA
jgi:hypothetical protein